MKQAFVLLFLAPMLTVACGKNETRSGRAPEVFVTSPVHLASIGPEIEDAAIFTDCLTKGRICSLDYLDFEQKAAPEKIKTIVSHTLVSDDWIAGRFQTYLENARPELLSMFSCVRGIVITGDIRPAFYSFGSGGVYLDAAFFAQTTEEWNTVQDKPDPRSEYADSTPYAIYTYKESLTHDIDSPESRLNFLLSHELAHACDAKHSEKSGHWLSDELPEIPRNLAFSWAQAVYLGDQLAAKRLQGVSPEEIGEAFGQGSIADPYGYSNSHENLAMYIQDILAFEFEGIVKTHIVADSNIAADGDAPIYWGVKGKICQPDIFKQAQALARRVIPSGIEFRKSIEDCPFDILPKGKMISEIYKNR